MTITKLGHCCLLIKENEKVIMTDPGSFSTAQNEVKGVDIIVITHEHADHFHIESLKQVLENNPNATVVSNSRVAGLLAEENIPCVIIEDQQKEVVEGIEIAGFGSEHATIYPTVPNVMNTGYLIANRFFLPGDAFVKPGVPIEILAMPMMGPWMKLSDSIDWVKEIHPKICIPVHDGMLQPREWIYRLPMQLFPEWGIQFDEAQLGKPVEI